MASLPSKIFFFACWLFSTSSVSANDFEQEAMLAGLTTFSTAESRVDLDFNNTGRGVVVWNDDTTADQILAQRLLVDGTLVGAPITVSDDSGDAQSDPAIGIDAQGNFVVTWTRDVAGLLSVRMRRFDVNGVAQGSEDPVHSDTTDNHFESDIAVKASGEFIVTWASGYLDGFGDVFTRHFSNSGVATSAEFRANTTTGFQQVNPKIALNSAGNYALAWEAQGMQVGWDIAYRLFDNGGQPLSGEVQVNHIVFNGDQRHANLAIDANSNVAVAWDCFCDSSGSFAIRARKFDPTGQPLMDEFIVNDYLPNNQTNAAVAMSATGEMLFAWTSHNSADFVVGIYGKHFDAAGAAAGGEFRISEEINPAQNLHPQVNAAIDTDSLGVNRVAWAGLRSASAETGVYMAATSLGLNVPLPALALGFLGLLLTGAGISRLHHR